MPDALSSPERKYASGALGLICRGHLPVGVQRHAQVHSMLPQEAQVLAGARPAQHAEGALLRWSDDDVNAPHPAVCCAEVAKNVVMPAQDSKSTPVKAKLIAT